MTQYPDIDSTDTKTQIDKARGVLQSEVESLDKFIHPSELKAGVESWEEVPDDVMDSEISEYLNVVESENQEPAAGMAYDIAIMLVRDDLPRVPMRHLVFNDRVEAVRKGYWPYGMDVVEVTEIIRNEYPGDTGTHFNEYIDDAYNRLFVGLRDAVDPRE